MCDVEADAADSDDLREELRAKVAKFVQDNRLFKPVDGEPGVYVFEPNREQGAGERARAHGGTARNSASQLVLHSANLSASGQHSPEMK